MCDILIAGPKNTKEGIFIFAKNSDRDPNEAQVVEFIKGGEIGSDEIKLTYVEIELSRIKSLKGIKFTNSVLLSRPWWIWGAEMGANDKGLVIGNTAVFTRRVNEKPGILGMDMIRLALMFKSTASESVELITEIVEKLGQGGSGSYEHKMFYDNSFIISDPDEAYLVETVGHDWAVKKIDRFYAISNRLTIQKDWDRCSSGVLKLKAENSEFNFADNLSDKLFSFFAHGYERRKFTCESLSQSDVDLTYMIKILSSTGQVEGKLVHVPPEKGSMRDVCMHYGGLLRPSQTASSQISELYKDLQVHWFTATSLPCLSLFKPIYLISGLPQLNSITTNRYDPNSYWWFAEKFHRKFQLVYSEFIEEFAQERNNLQKEIIEKEREVRLKYLNNLVGKEALYKLTEWTFKVEKELIVKWEDKIDKSRSRGKYFYKLIWKGLNRKANLLI